MPERKSLEDHLVEKFPELVEMSKFYESLGVSRPILWAKSELDGKPSVAKCLLRHGFLSEIGNQEDHSWSDRIATGDVNCSNQGLIKRAQDCLDDLAKLGVTPEHITPIIRLTEAQAVKNIAQLLDLGPEILLMPMPGAQRDQSWTICSETPQGEIGPRIGSLIPLLNDPNEI